AFGLLREGAAHFLHRHDNLVRSLAHRQSERLPLELELRPAHGLAPRPADLAAEHLYDVFLAPGLDDVAGDVLAILVARGDDVADLLLALFARFLLRRLLGRELSLGRAQARGGRRRLLGRSLSSALRGTVLGFERAGGKRKDGC